MLSLAGRRAAAVGAWFFVRGSVGRATHWGAIREPFGILCAPPSDPLKEG